MNKDGGVQFLTSKLLIDAGVKHGWFMRYGGVSAQLFKSLNGKKGNGDSTENVEENRRRALRKLCHSELDSGSNCTKDSCLGKNDTMSFISHSFENNVNIVTEPGEYKDFDASLTAISDIVLAHATADCGSIIIADQKGTVVSLIHGSWHTLATNIIHETVKKIRTHSFAELVAGIGPMICKNCYEFGPEAVDLFNKKYLRQTSHKYLVDLKQMILDQLHQAGVSKIDDLNICTIEDKRFFSHRRSGAQSGRFLTLASL